MAKTITIIGSGMMGSALAFPARENVLCELDSSIPMLKHAADVLDAGKDARLPWDDFTFDQTNA